ncbi:MAG: hypothetical protein AABZ47_01490 [Planctomycetota bacterium]
MKNKPTLYRLKRLMILGIRAIGVFAILPFANCDSLGPGFVNQIDPLGTSGLANIGNAPGHVVVAFANNAEVDERLLLYLETAGGLMLPDAEKRTLSPRIRFRVLITYAGGETATVEFVDGSRSLVESTFTADSEPDLNQNDLTNVVVLCDVARIEVILPVQVFVPVTVTGFEFDEGNEVLQGVFRPSTTPPPSFRSLLVDERDTDGNTTLRRNIGVLDGPAPVMNPACGSLVTIILDGVLSVPFFNDIPGFSIEDPNPVQEASIGGRYEFRVSVQ